MFGGSEITQIMSISVGENTIGRYSLALILFCFLWSAIRGFRLVGLRRLRAWADSTPYKLDSQILKCAAEISPLFFAYLSFYAVVKYFLIIGTSFEHFLEGAFVLLLIVEMTQVIQKMVKFVLQRTPLAKNKTTLHGVQRMFTIIIWSISLLMILSNLGVNITTLVASLGIGGIAIAFALQNILGDIFSSFSIYFDKPFQEGDYIIVGDYEGEIKQIGLKTTRIEALRGEEIIISNKELTESRVNNFKTMQRRRDELMISVAFDTPLKKLKKVPDLITKAIKEQKEVDLDFVRLNEFEASSYGFSVVYHVNSGSYDDYMEKREAVHWGILEYFEKEKVQMSLPTSIWISRVEK